MLIETLSVFPEMFEPVMSTSILGRARKAGLFDFKAYKSAYAYARSSTPS